MNADTKSQDPFEDELLCMTPGQRGTPNTGQLSKEEIVFMLKILLMWTTRRNNQLSQLWKIFINLRGIRWVMPQGLAEVLFSWNK